VTVCRELFNVANGVAMEEPRHFSTKILSQAPSPCKSVCRHPNRLEFLGTSQSKEKGEMKWVMLFALGWCTHTHTLTNSHSLTHTIMNVVCASECVPHTALE
jgi:hypothetical protein